MSGFFTTLENFWKRPFNSQGDAVNWILFLGFLLLVIWGWSRVISKITTG